MKAILAALCLGATAAAQTTGHPPVHHTTTTAAAGCTKVPEVSPKIPALPAGTTCAKVLYTLQVQPPVKIAYVSPLEGTALQDTLGLGEESFSLLYVDTKVGTGELAQPKKWYSIRYTGYLQDGTVFDSNADKPDQPLFSFPYGAHQVINGWDTGFAGMHVGGKRRLFIPFQLAYGANGRPPKIPPKSMLIFDLEFVAQSDTEPKQPERPAPPAASHQAPAATQPPAAGTTPPASTSPSTPPASTAPKPQ
ncbi:MAG TPA: FKBP-type peptidyl-prolyl cis-trans isomerase [Acidobacteriaceae bacterium]|nr:FKBP-type peptidyl-prolyl cis-trans isomerase [Acidobacteriaceae bacterium]